jgi:malate synthase
MSSSTAADGVRIDAPMKDRYDEVLTPEALEFLAGLHRAFDARRRELLELRGQRYAELAAGGTMDFLAETKDVREDDTWRVASHAPGLVDRRAEITGPTDRKMTINALNSGAKVWLADLEDANTPLWAIAPRSPPTAPPSGSGRAAGTCGISTCWSPARAPRGR